MLLLCSVPRQIVPHISENESCPGEGRLGYSGEKNQWTQEIKVMGSCFVTINLLALREKETLSAWASLVAPWLKNLLAMQEIRVPSPGREDPLEEGMATNSSILAWRISVDRRALSATVHKVTKSSTRKHAHPQCLLSTR